MKKHIIILTSLLSLAEGTIAQELQEITTEEKEVIILMAKPEDKEVLKDFLRSRDINKIDAAKVQEILRKMIYESRVAQPMMTKSLKGD